MSNLETSLRQLAASLDLAALEALASKGLVRRAQKDLERGVVVRVERETAAGLGLVVDSHQVILPAAGPAQATCSCPAAGVCQHIVAAMLFLRAHGQGLPKDSQEAKSGGAAPVAPEDRAWMTLTAEQLEVWAGAVVFRNGKRLADQHAAELVPGSVPRVRFALLNAECHLVPGGGLDGVIVAAADPALSRALVVAALIHWQRAHGIAWPGAGPDPALGVAEGTPRSRAEVLRAGDALLRELLLKGLARVSAADQQRWSTLAVSALGVQLPRLSALWRGIADETAWALARDARANLGRLLGRMAQAFALSEALKSNATAPRSDWVGLHRTEYHEVGNLELVGVAAWPWRVASGYHGLTVLFWDRAGQRWNSWTHARPLVQSAGFHPVSCYWGPGPWADGESPHRLAGAEIRVLQARRNGEYRLSSSSRSRALVVGTTDLAQSGVPVLAEWSALAAAYTRGRVLGLKNGSPLDAVVVVRPTDWAERSFDPVTQVFRWTVYDADGCPLRLELSYDELTRPALEYLEHVALETVAGASVVGRCYPTRSGWCLEPYALHRAGGGQVNLALDTTRAQAAAVKEPSPADEAEWVEEVAEAPAVMSDAVTLLLNELDDLLLEMAERGLSGNRRQMGARWQSQTAKADQLHLEVLARGLRACNLTAPSVDHFLRCAFLVSVHRQGLETEAVAGQVCS